MRIKKDYKETLFRILIFTFIFIFIAFILMTISVVLVKGFPSLLESLKDKEIQFAIRLSFLTSTISTLICLIFSVPISYGLARYNFRGKRIINSLIQIPISIPPIASGIALLLLFSTSFVTKILARVGFDPVFTVYGIIIANFFINTPYMIRILRVTFEDINPRLELVARTLGYSSWGAFIKVTLLLARNGLISGIIITWTVSLGEFGTAFMLAGAIRMKTETLPVAIFLNLAGGDLDKSFAAASILIIMSLVCLFLFGLLEKGTKKTCK